MKPANGELRSTTGGLVARITIKGRHRESFPLWGSGDEAKARRKLVAGVAVRFRKAGVVGQPEAIKLLRTIAAAAPAVLDSALAVASELAGGELVRDDQAARPVVTFRQLGELSTMLCSLPRSRRARTTSPIDRGSLWGSPLAL